MEVPEIQYKLFLYFQTDNMAEEYKYTEMVSKAGEGREGELN